MRNLKLEIEYDGTNYCGWQIQKSHKVTCLSGRQTKSQGHRSIQGVIEKNLHKILQEKVRLVVSGRTDAGVHAKAQVANFKTKSSQSLDKLQRALNGLLPDDIVVTRIEEKDLDFHSRFDARSKVYRYTILNSNYPSALSRNTLFFYPYPLDIKIMQKEARALLGRHNFSSFQASKAGARSAVRSIKKIKIARINDLIYIDIEANGFLYNMARNIVGTLIEVGRGKLPLGSLKRIVAQRNRKFAGPTAPARGLSLVQVKY